MKTKISFRWVPAAYVDGGGYWSGNNIYGVNDGADIIVVDVDLPEMTDDEKRHRAVSALKEKKDEIIAEATRQANVIDEQIQQLLALPSSAAA